MQTIILQMLKLPYFYIFLGMLLIIILCITFNKKIKALFKNINIHFKRTNTITLDCTTRSKPKNNTAIKVENVDIENSKTSDIEGNVSINNAKIKDSTIGSIRGR